MIFFGLLLGWVAFTFFGTVAVLLPFLPLMIALIATAKRLSVLAGSLLLLLTIISISIERPEINSPRLENLVVVGSWLLMLAAFIHLVASSSVDSRNRI
jgi:hypothetical protein